MSLSNYKILPVCMLSFATLLSAATNSPDEKKDRIAILENRLAKLEARLSESETLKDQYLIDAEARIKALEVQLAEAHQKAKIAEQFATESAFQKEDYSVVKNNPTTEIPTTAVNGKLLWTQEKQWDEIEPGVTMDKVIELLGTPPRSLDSLKPRVDKVFFYQTNPKLSSYPLHGKISFRKGKVLAVEKPDFEQTEQY